MQYQLRKDSELFYTAEYNDNNPASYFTEEISTEWLVNEGGENRFTFIHTYPYGTSVNGKYYENVKYRIQRIDFYDNFTKQYFNEAFYYDNNGNELFSQWETKGESDSHLKREALQGEILYYKSLLYLNYDGSDLTLLRGAKESDSNAGDKGSTSETKNNQPQIAKYKIDISKGKWKEFEYGVFVNTHTEFDELGIKGCIKIDDYISEDITYDYYNLDLDEYMFITRETQGSEQEEVMEILGESVFTRCFTAIKNMYLKKLKAERDGRWIIVSGKNDFNLAIARDFNTYGNNICIEIEARLTDEALRNADPEMKQLNIRKRWMKLTFKNDNLGQIIRSEMAWVDNKGNKLYGEQSNEAIGIYDFFKQDEFTQEAIENIFAAKKSVKDNLTPINVEENYSDSYYPDIAYIDYINNNYNFDYKFKFHRYFDDLDKAVELYGHKCYRVDTEIEFNKEFTKYKILSEKHYDKNDNLIAEKRGGSGFENINKFDDPNISDYGYYYQIEAFAAESLHNIIILFYQ